jgi:hypothetical protein
MNRGRHGSAQKCGDAPDGIACLPETVHGVKCFVRFAGGAGDKQDASFHKPLIAHSGKDKQAPRTDDPSGLRGCRGLPIQRACRQNPLAGDGTLFSAARQTLAGVLTEVLALEA